MATFPTVKVNACMIETENSIPTQFAKDRRSYKYDDLQFAVENPVDFESLRVNGFPEVKELFEKQDLMYYFDILNGPTYTELIKEFWMKASVITRESYTANLKKLIKERPKLQGKSPAAMGLRPFVSTEIDSYMAGFRVSIRLVHIFEALKLSYDGLFLKTTNSIAPDVEQFIYKDKPKPEAKPELTNICKVIYKILIDCIVPKLGGTDQLSVVQKLFTFHVGKGNLLDVAKLIFIHLLDAIEFVKPIIHHSRLLSHMFAQCGLLDAVKPFFHGYGTYLTCSKVVNSTTLRYLHLVKNAKIVYPTHPLIIRETEDGIGECRLVHVSDRDARIIAETHAKFLNDLGAEVGSGETRELSVRQSRILNQPSRVFLKRKAAKSPAKSCDKKVAKTSTGPRKSRKPKVSKKVLLDATEEEKEKAEIEEAILKVAELEEKEKKLEDTYECHIDPSEFDEMYSKLPSRDDPQTLAANQKIYGPVGNGKSSDNLDNSSALINVFQKPTFKQPILIPVKCAYDRIFKGVNSKKDLTLSENQHRSKPFNPLQTNPSESQANIISNDAAQATTSCTAPVIHSVDDDDDSEATPSPPPLIKNTSPHKSREPTPEVDKTKPSSPPLEKEPHKSPEPHHSNSEAVQDPKSPVIVVEKSPHHVVVDNTFTASHSLNPRLQEISRTLDMDLVIKSPPHTSDLNNLMTDYSNECIYVPPHLPSRVLNEPISDTKEDITKLLQAVDKNIRRINISIPNMSIDSAAIDKECDLMEVEFQNMMKAVREAYKKDLEFRKELARLEAERLEKEKKEAEERERKRLEDERIEKERIEAEEREQARLAEEARIAAEQARLADFARNAPEFAILMREDQENLKRTVSDHSTMLAKIFATLQSIDARLPPPPPPPPPPQP
ncbi:hypothetical protein QL285_070010 [Trifolium repens]|nr:hypothetical protein QL285_070010 [Trifolium repens]